MRRDRDLTIAASLTILATVTGTWGVVSFRAVPRRTELDAPLDRGPEMAVHIALVLGFAIWAVARLARRVRLRREVAMMLRIAGWMLVPAFVWANARHSGVAGGDRDLFLAATTLVVPIWPVLLAALVFDLGLLQTYRGDSKPSEGFEPPSGVIALALYAGLWPIAFVGALAWASRGQEFPVAPLFEALAFDAVWAIALLILGIPVAILWAFIAGLTGAPAGSRPTLRS